MLTYTLMHGDRVTVSRDMKPHGAPVSRARL